MGARAVARTGNLGLVGPRPRLSVAAKDGKIRPVNAGFMGRGYPGCGLVRRVLLASPRGYCAGVERAVDTVERALRHYGEPVYVRKQIVHNSHVVRELEGLGAIFVDSVADAPYRAATGFAG